MVSRGVQQAAEAQLGQLARLRGLAAGANGAPAAKTQQRRLAEAPGLPPPMVPENYEANATSCHLQVSQAIGDEHACSLRCHNCRQQVVRRGEQCLLFP
jgi:hypothetical protein